MKTATKRMVEHVTVDLCQGDTELDECRLLPEREYRDSYYASPQHPLSIVEFPDDGDQYEKYTCSKVVRENARYAWKRGYRYTRIDRAEHEDDLFAIRSSARHRQGRRMPADYLKFQRYGSDEPPTLHCKRHLATVHGIVAPWGPLVAYCQIVQCGEVARVNTILGHADRLEDRVMWLLMLETFRWHIEQGDARYGLYFTHDSGHGPGLRYWKERFGMRPTKATWVFA